MSLSKFSIASHNLWKDGGNRFHKCNWRLSGACLLFSCKRAELQFWWPPHFFNKVLSLHKQLLVRAIGKTKQVTSSSVCWKLESITKTACMLLTHRINFMWPCKKPTECDGHGSFYIWWRSWERRFIFLSWRCFFSSYKLLVESLRPIRFWPVCNY